MSKVKRLFAIHRDYTGKVYRTKIAEGTTADFAEAIGFQIEDFDEHNEVHANGRSSGGSESLGLNGTYAALHAKSFSGLEGKLLTLCDATFTNKEQREAFKGMVRDTLWTAFSGITDPVIGNYSLSDPNPRFIGIDSK